jgi:putative FmdB family regulatory protein
VPIYDYRCQTCGRQFDELHQRNADATPACPACGGTDVSRLISLIAGLSSGGSNGGPAASGGGCGCGGACACGR